MGFGTILPKQYEVPLSRILHDILDDDQTIYSDIHHWQDITPIFDRYGYGPYYRIWLFT